MSIRTETGKATGTLCTCVALPDYKFRFAPVTFKAIHGLPKYILAIPSIPHNQSKYKEASWTVFSKSEHYSVIQRPQCKAKQSDFYSGFSSP